MGTEPEKHIENLLVELHSSIQTGIERGFTCSLCGGIINDSDFGSLLVLPDYGMVWKVVP